MKIYCILFDAVPRTKKIEDLFRSKGLHYCDFVANGSTGSTLVPLFSGKSLTEIAGPGGVGHNHTYQKLSREKKKIWNEQMLLNNLPEDWNIHIHLMPPCNGDTEIFKFFPSEIFDITREYDVIQYVQGDEYIHMKKMQEDLSSDENHFIYLHYNRYHHAKKVDRESAIESFLGIIDTIDFEEENSLFWVFADHGSPERVDEMMSPPDSWLSWVSVTDNITNKLVTKYRIGMQDFYGIVMNRVNKENSYPHDIFDAVDIDRIYVGEDGRGKVDPNKCTTVCAIRGLDEYRYIQVAYHYSANKLRTVVYDVRDGTTTETDVDVEMLDYLKSNVWKWYF